MDGWMDGWMDGRPNRRTDNCNDSPASPLGGASSYVHEFHGAPSARLHGQGSDRHALLLHASRIVCFHEG